MRRWFFQPGGHPTSHVLRAGWSRPVTRLLDVELHAGPAITDGRAALDVAAAVRHGTRPRDLAISYSRTQTTIIGLSGVADTQSLTASGAVRPGPGLTFRASPGVSRIVHAGRPVVGWRFAFDAERQLRRTLLLRLSVRGRCPARQARCGSRRCHVASPRAGEPARGAAHAGQTRNTFPFHVAAPLDVARGVPSVSRGTETLRRGGHQPEWLRVAASAPHRASVRGGDPALRGP